MNTVLLICAIVLTIAIVAAIVYVIMTLSQVRKTAREAQILLQNINQEISTITRITGNLSAFIDRLTSPWAKAGGWLTGILTTLFMKHRREKTQDRAENTAKAGV